jgi:sideroflexin-5
MYLANKLAALKGPRLIIASAALNYLAAALSGAANLVMIRRKEMEKGISV